jgi:hypothetical protein
VRTHYSIYSALVFGTFAMFRAALGLLSTQLDGGTVTIEGTTILVPTPTLRSADIEGTAMKLDITGTLLCVGMGCV